MFNVLSIGLHGNETAASSIRQKICEQMVNLSFSTVQLFVNGSLCNSVQDYLQRRSMKHDFTYGGVVEVSAFSNLTQIPVVFIT